MIPSIAQVVVGLPVEGPFDYLIPEELSSAAAVGQRVLVRFAGKKRVGVVVRLLEAPVHAGRLSALIKVLDEQPVFSAAFLVLAEKFAARFACTPGEALDMFLPAYLRGAKKFDGGIRGHVPNSSFELGTCALIPPELLFDRGQARRWDSLVPRMAQVLHEGRGVLVLVPDSTRCPDILPKLGPLVKADERVLLTPGTDKEEYGRWREIRSGKARLVVGFISAAFAPVKDLGLIVVIEEESPSYRNDQSPFYHARAVALMRGAIEDCAVVAVSSAPSVEMWHMAQTEEAALTVLDEPLAPVKFFDLTNFKMRKGTFISPALRQHIEAGVKDGGKVLLYIQAARGVAGVVEEVKHIFPAVRVAGYDKTSRALPENFDVLVATQAVFRFRSSFKAAVSAVLDIDWEFHRHDHQAAHGAFALVQHLRQMTAQCVFLQTRHAADTLLHALAADDAADFYRRELLLRSEMGLPPFAALVTVIVRGADPALACAEAKRLYDILLSVIPDDASVLEPQPDRTAIVRGKFRYCVSLNGPDRAGLAAVLKGVLKTFRAKKDTVVTVRVE